MKITRKQLRILLTEVIQDHPGVFDPGYAGVDMDIYDKQFGGERQTRKQTPQEQGELLAKRAQWKAELADAQLDEGWLVDKLEDYHFNMSLEDAINEAMKEFPGMQDPEESLLRVIADSVILNLNSDTQQIHY